LSFCCSGSVGWTHSSLLVQSWIHLWWGVNHWDHPEDTYVLSHPFDETPPTPDQQITHWTRSARCVASGMGNHGTMPALCDFQWECSQPPYNSMSVTVSDLTLKTALQEGIQGNFWASSSPLLFLIPKHRTSRKSAVCNNDKRQTFADECDSFRLFEYFLNFVNIFRRMWQFLSFRIISKFLKYFQTNVTVSVFSNTF